MAAPEAWPLCLSVILIYALHHAFAKGALFLAIGVASATGSGKTQRSLVIAGLLIPAFALAGLPFSSGAVAKAGLTALSDLLPSAWSDWMAVALSLVAIGTALLMARFLYLVWPRRCYRPGAIRGLGWPWAFLLAFVIGSVWLWPLARETGLRTLSIVEIWHAFWPIGVAVTGAWAMWTRARKVPEKLPFNIPAGDILYLATGISDRLYRGWTYVADRCRPFVANRESAWQRFVARLRAVNTHHEFELELQRWRIAGLAFLSMLVIVFLMFAMA